MNLNLFPIDRNAIVEQTKPGYRPLNDALFTTNNHKIMQPFIRLGVHNVDDEEDFHPKNDVFCNVPNCNTKFETVYDYECHYNAWHRFLCSQCSKALPSAHLLDLHLSEIHDSFFAVQAEKKPMFVCFIEECSHKCQTPVERRDHCIGQHKFPHDFRFEMINHKKKSHTNDKKKKKEKSKISSIIQPAKLLNDQGHDDEDIELEDKSIALLDNRKPIKAFSFGRSKVKTFSSLCDLPNENDSMKSNNNNRKGKHSKKQKTKEISTLESDKMIVDLMESLPK